MPHLESQINLKPLLANYYTGLKAPLAWCTSVGPAEILRALGFEVYFPENHGALLGASRTAGRYIPRAHQAGYAGEICSYLTADIGAWLSGETPLTKAYGIGEVPKPDLIVFSTNQCREVAEWFDFFGREYGCPTVGIFPPRYLETITVADIDQVVAQFENLIDIGEDVIGRRLDPVRLKEVVGLSREASELWMRILSTAKSTPAPMTFFDDTIIMAPIVVLRGTQSCIDYYREVLAELEGLVAGGTSAVPDEHLRIYWEGMPIWGRLRFLADLFRANGAAVVASTYCNSWIFEDLDPDDPLRSLAYAYTQIFINRGENAKLEMLIEMCAGFQIDGMIFHDSKTCFNNANSRFGLPARIHKRTGLPTLGIDGDLNDLRFFSDGQTQTRLETFFEQLMARQEVIHA